LAVDVIDDARGGADTAARIRRIWSDVLQTSVGEGETFLDLGGDSLTAMSCIYMMRDAFGVEFAVDDFLMDDATVAGFAARVGHSAPPLPR
jgi:acyl carrier protein